MIVKYHVERFTERGWVRVAADLPEHHVATNMKNTLAKHAGIDPENYSILVEVS